MFKVNRSILQDPSFSDPISDLWLVGLLRFFCFRVLHVLVGLLNKFNF